MMRRIAATSEGRAADGYFFNDRCAACSGDLVEDLVSPGNIGYDRCTRCRSLQRSGTLSKREIDGWYDSDYRPAGSRYVWPHRLVRSFMWRRVARNLDEIVPSGIIVDVGAGEGDLAQALRRRGRVSIALDPYSRSEHVEPLHLAQASFHEDVACLVYWHSFEHVADPSAELTAMAELLPEGGMVLFGLPNPCSLQAQVTGGHWSGLDEGRHLCIMSRAGLATLLEHKGFAVVPRVWHGGDCGQGFVGWLSALLGWVGWSSRADQLVLTKSDAPPLFRVLGLMLAAGFVPFAAGLTAVEKLLGRPGSTTLVASRVRAAS